jgi:transcriptional regulator with XRE-family HTH domain
MKINQELVGHAVARLREMRGLTQSELNHKVGMSTIQHIEQGRNAVSLASLNKIAKALDVPAACIVLLGSDIDTKDKLLSSLRSLTEKTIGLANDGGRVAKAGGAKSLSRSAARTRKRKRATA